MTRPVFRSFVIAALLGLAACSGTLDAWDENTPARLTAPVHMTQRQIDAEPFLLTSYERVRQEGGEVTIYIEGDGPADFLANTPLKGHTATPSNPVALHLASHDLSPNVIWIARPCQYTGSIYRGHECKSEYWTTKRYSPETVKAMDTALNEVKARYGFKGFHLVGYGGGGAIAALLTAQRDDIIDLRTVAGVLNTDLMTRMQNVPAWSDSIDPITVADKIKTVPQHHFIGDWDEVVTPPIYQSFRMKAQDTPCMRGSIVKKADFRRGWVDAWAELLKAPVDCKSEH
jgi:hypothetical protein